MPVFITGEAADSLHSTTSFTLHDHILLEIVDFEGGFERTAKVIRAKKACWK